MELRFPEKDEWSKRFNYVGRLYDKIAKPGLTLQEQDAWWQEYLQQKYNLEQGLPISIIEDLSLPHPSIQTPGKSS